MKLFSLLFASFALVFTCANADADIALSFSLPQTPATGAFENGVDGFDFTPTASLTVTALGWYDHDGDGLLHDHPVGIFDTATQTLVAPAVTVDNSSTLDPTTNFRFQSVTQFVLNAGTSYTLVGYAEGPIFDPYISDPSGGLIIGPNVALGTGRGMGSAGLEFPTLTSAIFTGPSFQYTAVPEPNSICLLGIAATCFVFRRNRRSRTKR